MDFYTLDQDEQLRRLEQTAKAALSEFKLSNAVCQFLTYTNNAVYRVTDGADEYILRVHRPDHKSLDLIRSELEWLMFLHHNMNMNVPQPKLVTYSGVLAGVESSVYCTLLTWIEGQPLQPEAISLEQVKAIGTYIARLHDSVAGFVPTDAFKRPRLDADGLLGEKSHYHPGNLEQFFSAEQQAVMADVIAKVRAVMAKVGTSSDTFGMIHADLISKNVLFDENKVGVIDFEECGHGYYLYDLAPMLWENRKSPRYAQIKAALWAGYTAIRPQQLPYEQYLEAFVAARHVASCLWVAGNADHPAIRGHVTETLSERVNEMRRFLQTGSIAQGN